MSHFPDICSRFLCSWSRDNNELYLVHIWNHFYLWMYSRQRIEYMPPGSWLVGLIFNRLSQLNISNIMNILKFAMMIVARFLACGTNLQLPNDWPALLKGWHRYSESNLRFMKSIWDLEICINNIKKNRIHYINKINLKLIISIWDLKRGSPLYKLLGAKR